MARQLPTRLRLLPLPADFQHSAPADSKQRVSPVLGFERWHLGGMDVHPLLEAFCL